MINFSKFYIERGIKMRFYDVLDAEIDYREQYLQESFAAGIANYEYHHMVYEAEMAAIEAYDTNHDKALLEAQISVILEGWISKAWNKVKEWFKKAWKAIKSFFKWVKKNILKAWNWLKKKFKAITENMTSVYEASTKVFKFNLDVAQFLTNIKKLNTYSIPNPAQFTSMVNNIETAEELKEKVIGVSLNNIGIKYSPNISEVLTSVIDFVYSNTDNEVTYSESDLDRIQKDFMKTLGHYEEDVDELEEIVKKYDDIIDRMEDNLKENTELSEQKISFVVNASKSMFEYGLQLDKTIVGEMNKVFMSMIKQFARQSA